MLYFCCCFLSLNNVFSVVSFIRLVALSVLFLLFPAGSAKAVLHTDAPTTGLQLFYNEFEAYAPDGP